MSTTRNSRSLAALRPGAVALDPRSPRRLLADTPATAALFNFYDSAGAPSARWSRFYEEVPIVRYARLAELDPAEEALTCRALLDRLQNRHHTFHFDAHDALQLAAVRALVSRLLHLYRSLDRDAEAFARFPGELQFAATLQRSIKQVFAADYRAVYAWRHRLEMAVDRHFPPLRKEWWGEPPPDGEREDPRALYQATWSTLAALGQLVPQAQAGFAARFAQPAGLPPHFALYLAFVSQFSGAQAALNTLPTRHRDYFYREVLGMEPAPVQPDTAVVAFLAAPNSAVDLPAGTLLTAGKDAFGLPIVYALNRDTPVTTSAVARLDTLWVGPPGGTGGATLARHAAAASPSWATLGEDQSKLPPGTSRTMADAQVGFAISSPTLQLEEGTRVVTLTIAFAAPASAAAGPAASSPTNAAAFGAGLLSYSGPTGWVPVDPALVTFMPSPAGAPLSLTISFTLPATAAPCVNYDPKVLGPGYDPRTPCLRVIFANPVNALTLPLRLPAVASVTVAVTVTGVQNLALSGPGGKLAPGKPLPLFGAPPRANATLFVGSAEVFRKRLSALSLRATWQDLPPGAPDLRPYFAPYLAMLVNPDPKMFRSDQYTVSLDALAGSGRVPLPLDDSTLFNWTAPSPAGPNPPPPSSIWTVGAAALASLEPDPALANPPNYSPVTGTGFLRLTLSAPDYLFGQPLYATVLAQVAAQNGLAMIAASRNPSKDPSAGTTPVRAGRSAYTILKQPARVGVLESLGHLLKAPARAPLTLASSLFDELKKIPSLPAAVTRAIEAAGGVKADELLPALVALEEKRFTDPASLRQLLADATKLDPKNRLAADAIDSLLQALAGLLLPPAAPAEDPGSSSPSPSAGGSTGNASVDLLPLPPPPLTPTASSLLLDYSASVEINLPATAPDPANPPAWDRLWQIAPLATYPVTLARPLLPELAAGGYLYLGLAGIQLPETVSLLFLMESASEKSLAALGVTAAQPLQWACLVGDTWREAASGGAPSDFSARNVHDGTFGFQRTGIVRIELPAGADTCHTVMPSGLVWLRAFAPDPALRLRTVQVLAHAAEAVWVPPAGAAPAALAAHFAQPLPAGSINALAVPDPAIAQVLQPLPAAGGAPAEDTEAFCVRASERLRHKGRAVAAPDYERLLLANYPGVFSARALAPASAADAGTVTLVVLPVVTQVPADPPPVFLPGDLDAMTATLQAVAPLGAAVKVVNPAYAWLTVSLPVIFRPDRSFKVYAARLSADLNAFISPWIYAQATVGEVRRSFQLSELTGYIRERLDYVELLGPCTITARDHAGVIITAWTDRKASDPRVEPASPLALFVGVRAHDLTPLAGSPA